MGDQEGVVKNGMTCSALIQSDPWQCTDNKIRYVCCASCDLNKSKFLNKNKIFEPSHEIIALFILRKLIL